MKTLLPLPLALLAAGCLYEPMDESSTSNRPRRIERPAEAPVPQVEEAPTIQRWPQPRRTEKVQDPPKAPPEEAPAQSDKPLEWPAGGFPARTPKGNHFIGPAR